MAEQKESYFRKSITVGETIAIALTLIGVAITFYTTVQVRLSSLELKMESVEKAQNMQVQFQERIENKLDLIKEDINAVKLEVKSNTNTNTNKR